MFEAEMVPKLATVPATQPTRCRGGVRLVTHPRNLCINGDYVFPAGVSCGAKSNA